MSDEQPPQTVPLSRLNSEIEARKKEAAARKASDAEVVRLTALAETIPALTAAKDAAEAGRKDDAARWGAREAFVRVGFDPDEDAAVMEVIRGQFEKLDPKDRGPLHGWLTGAALEDRIASALMPKPAPAPEPAPAAQVDEAPPAPPAPRATHTNAGARPTPPAGSGNAREVWQKRSAAATSSAEVKAANDAYFGTD